MRVKFLGLLALLTLVLSPAISNADDTTDRMAITARLGRISNIKVDYDIIYRTPNPNAGLIVKSAAGTPGIAYLPSGYTKHVVFTRASGMARWDTSLGESAMKWVASHRLGDSRNSSETYDGSLRQSLTKNGQQEVGAVFTSERVDRWLAVEIALGLCADDRGPWVTEKMLATMELHAADHDRVQMSFTPDRSRRWEWLFDRSLGYAVVEYRRLYKGKVDLLVQPSSFRQVDGMLLPSHVRMSYFIKPGAAEIGTNYEATIVNYDLHADRAPQIEYPKGAIFVDTRTGRQFLVGKDKQTVTDAILARATALKEASPDAPLIPRIRVHKAPTPHEAIFQTIANRAVLVAMWGLGILVVYYLLRRLQRRAP